MFWFKSQELYLCRHIRWQHSLWAHVQKFEDIRYISCKYPLKNFSFSFRSERQCLSDTYSQVLLDGIFIIPDYYKCLHQMVSWSCLVTKTYSLYYCSLDVVTNNGCSTSPFIIQYNHDDVIKWKNFPRCCPFVRGIHRSPVSSPHKGQWRGALMFSLITAWINGWVNNGEAGDLRCHRAHHDVTVMWFVVLYLQNALICAWTQSFLIRAMVCCLFGIKPEHEPKPTYWQLDP